MVILFYVCALDLDNNFDVSLTNAYKLYVTIVSPRQLRHNSTFTIAGKYSFLASPFEHFLFTCQSAYCRYGNDKAYDCKAESTSKQQEETQDL
ncbi:hypothetical protein QVD17_20299 [Tagetes erecta]|uniref:Uncharacterized protein n=1 Tax=Tagetes erecta TaxID=13708 RepID=A0AAD8KL97_TARER|nr:hypothetical protein QVD17_20299 [Tagetes erecta]